MLNPYINNYKSNENEQRLHQDLIIEAIQAWGKDFIYIPRKLVNFDQLYLTDDQSAYSEYVIIEAYLENIDGFQGQGNMFTKFGLDIRDQITLTMSKRRFNEVVFPLTSVLRTPDKAGRPMEGDLVFFDENKKIFQIKYVNDKEMFFSLGELPVYELTCELMEYSDETFNTGIPDVDSIQKNLSLNTLDNTYTEPDGTVLTDNNGNVLVNSTYDVHNIEPVADNADLEIEDRSFITTTNNPFGGITQ